MMTEEQSSLKPGWRKMKFGEVVRLSKVRSKDPLAEGYERYIGLEHLEPGDLRIRSWGNVADGTTFTNVFKPGHVLFGKRRAYQRKVAVAKFEGVCSGDIYVLESLDANVLLPELLPFICQTDAFFEHAVGTSAGSLSPRTNWTSLADFEFILPPILEQQRLRSLVVSVQDNVDSFSSLYQPASNLIAAILDSLFWQSHLSTDDCIQSEYFRVPAHWKLLRLPEIVKRESNSLTAGPFGTIFKAKDFRDSGVPIIQLRHVTKAGFSWGENVTYMDIAVYEKLHVPYTVRSGDLLITKMGEPPGLACIYPLNALDAMVTPDVIKATIDPEIAIPEYMMLVFNSARTSRAIAKFMKGGTRTRVSLDNFYSIGLPIPYLEEQEAIVKECLGIMTVMNLATDRSKDAASLQSRLVDQVFIGGGYVQ